MADGRPALGRRGEAEARRYLESLGYRVLAERVRSRFGEIDLVGHFEDAVRRESDPPYASLHVSGPRGGGVDVRRELAALCGRRRPDVRAVPEVLLGDRAVRCVRYAQVMRLGALEQVQRFNHAGVVALEAESAGRGRPGPEHGVDEFDPRA
jgi:hypothetical protein